MTEFEARQAEADSDRAAEDRIRVLYAEYIAAVARIRKERADAKEAAHSGARGCGHGH
ncbi:hypothetical protein HB662_19840 [Roseomonas frigidaquae]|uniref:Uncharacterized protein n=1 Tax=Falsiroseomonas frigidaquae TaxID=487318 RepID=A0ABX1F3V6_9PROT|nr:hypothetical protein [Falsiroseomonas frigidaquae]NKE47042.1 hypothetical protein [Falsiroseomonas frigidaquae]